jgi:hypothetical protein
MKRTTIYLEPELEMRLKVEGLRRKQPMASLVREAVEAYLGGGPLTGPPGAGAFASGGRDTADRVDDVLAQTGFGSVAPAAAKPSTKPGVRPSARRGARRAKRRA